MRNVLWREKALTCGGAHLLVRGARAELSLKNVKDLILIAVEMERRGISMRRPMFEQGDFVAPVSKEILTETLVSRNQKSPGDVRFIGSAFRL